MTSLLNISWPQFLEALLPWALPLVGALVILLFNPFLRKAMPLTFGFSFIICLISLWLAWKNWLSLSLETQGLLLFDRFTYLFVIFFLMAALFTFLLSKCYLKFFGIDRPEFYALLLFAVFGMGCMVSGHDLMVVFLGLEIMSIAIYVLAGFQRTNTWCVEAALKYFLMGAFASSFLLLGIAFIYGAFGTTDLLLLNQKLGQGILGETRTFALLGIAFLGVGFAFKMALVPFHLWVADVYTGAPVVVTAFMATAVKAAGFSAFLRVVWALFQWEPVLFSKIIFWAAILTMTVGNVAALRQKNIKRILAFSSIAHAGYALVPLVAFSTAQKVVISSIGFYLLTYLLMTVGAFAVLVALTEHKGEECTLLDDLKGVGKKKPFLGFAFTVLMLSLAGVPPTMGFFGKYYLFLPAIQQGSIFLVIIAVLNSVVSVYYYLAPVVWIYFKGEETETLPENERIHFSLNTFAVIWLTVLSILFFGLFPTSLLELIGRSVFG